jgi:hypothetical protein
MAAARDARTTGSVRDRSQIAIPNAAAPVRRSHQAGTSLSGRLIPGEVLNDAAFVNAPVCQPLPGARMDEWSSGGGQSAMLARFG